jgi:renierapurpurin 18,18'-hydroxylase
MEVKSGEGEGGEGISEPGSGDRGDFTAPQEGSGDDRSQHLDAGEGEHAPEDADGKAASNMLRGGFEANESKIEVSEFAVHSEYFGEWVDDPASIFCGGLLQMSRERYTIAKCFLGWMSSMAYELSVAPSFQDIRQVGLNPNHWYVAAMGREVTTKPVGIVFWGEAIVLFRDTQGQVQALEDRCPHRQVKLSEGQVKGNTLECAYHGWQFDGMGQCVAVPHLEEQQKLPSCRIRRYPVQERDGFVWIFPGEGEPSGEPFAISEWEDLDYIGSVAPFQCGGHFSFLIENLMDMYHGHLHNNYQAWANPQLEDLEEDGDRVHAHYQAQSYYKIDKIWSVSQLLFPALRQLHPEPLDVSYVYPHWAAALGQDFRIYCLLCPISPTETRAYLLHFTSLKAFPRLQRHPDWFRRWIKNRFFGSARLLLEGLIRQDVKMIEQEQQSYLQHPERRNYELNRAIASVQRLIRRQVGSLGS